MRERLRVLSAPSPYKLVSENLTVARGEFSQLAADGWGRGRSWDVTCRMQRLLELIEALEDLKAIFEMNDWCDG